MLHHKGRWIPLSVIELSHHGVRVYGRGSYNAGDEVTVQVTTPGRIVDLAARVVWNGHGRNRLAGLEFLHVSDDDARALDVALDVARHGLDDRENPTR